MMRLDAPDDPLGPEAGEFTLRQLQHFVAVAEEGAMNAAAERLYLSPSAVAASITALERALGTDLCIRRRAQGVRLTPSGRLVFQRARALIEEARELRYFVDSTDGELVGPLEIGCYLTLSPTVLPGLLDGYVRTNPRVDVNFVESGQVSLVEQLRGGEIDLAILYDMGGLDEFETVTLFKARGYALFAEGHPLAEREVVSLELLAPEPFVLYDLSPSADYVSTAFTERGLHPNVRWRTTAYETTRAIVARGGVYGILVQRPTNSVSFEGLPIVERDVDPPLPLCAVVIAWSREYRLTPRARRFIDGAIARYHTSPTP